MQGYNIWSETQAGTNGGATASHTAETGKTFIITRISGHTDGDSTIQVLGGAAGATVLAEFALDVSVDGFKFDFEGPWVGTAGIKVEGKITASTADCQANLIGYAIP